MDVEIGMSWCHVSELAAHREDNTLRNPASPSDVHHGSVTEESAVDPKWGRNPLSGVFTGRRQGMHCNFGTAASPLDLFVVEVSSVEKGKYFLSIS